MRFELKTTAPIGGSSSPSKVFRKWVLIGAALGAVLVGIFGAILLGFLMIGGAIVGAGFGVIFGLFKAAVAAFSKD